MEPSAESLDARIAAAECDLARVKSNREDTLDYAEGLHLTEIEAQCQRRLDALRAQGATLNMATAPAANRNGKKPASPAVSPEGVAEPDHRCADDHPCDEEGEHLCAKDHDGAPASPTTECTEAVRGLIESPVATEAARDHGAEPAAATKRRKRSSKAKKGSPSATPQAPDEPPPASSDNGAAGTVPPPPGPSDESEGQTRVEQEQTERPPRSDERAAPDHPDQGTPPLYEVRPDGMRWNKRVKRKGETVIEPTSLSNFQARISAEVTEDDGSGDPRKCFEIWARVPGDNRPRTVTIQADEYRAMNWVDTKLGALARVLPGYGIADRLRDAIKYFSGEMKRRTVYTHTGWRKIDGKWLYLHGGGAIGAEGHVKNVTVRLVENERLTHFVLPKPPTGDELREAVRASMALLTLAPREVTIPLVAATYLAPLCEFFGNAKPKLTMWLHGGTGEKKTALAVLLQSHFGDFSEESLPCTFEDTDHAVERTEFLLKDALCVVDDFRPTTSRSQAQAMDKTAERVLRGAGNKGGRARMGAERKLETVYYPRGIPLVTSELSTPSGLSTGVRAFVVSLSNGAVDVARLTDAQANHSLLRTAMAGFIRWVAEQADLRDAGRGGLTIETDFATSRRVWRDLLPAGHDRLPEQAAHLMTAVDVFGAFLRDIDFPEEEVVSLITGAFQVLKGARAEQALQLAEENPVQQFLTLLREGFPARKIYVERIEGGEPPNPRAWGWEEQVVGIRDGEEITTWRHPLSSPMLGWLTPTHLLLLPGETKSFLHRAMQGTDKRFPVDFNTLLVQLDEEQHIEVELEKSKTGGQVRRREVNQWVPSSGKTARVVKLRLSALEVGDGSLVACPQCGAKVPAPTFNGASQVVAPCSSCKVDVTWSSPSASLAS